MSANPTNILPFPTAKPTLEARHAHRRDKRWDEAAWLMKQKQRPVRAKPYSMHASACECAELARKAGWQRVEIVEIKKGEAPKRASLMTKGK